MSYVTQSKVNAIWVVIVVLFLIDRKEAKELLDKCLIHG